MCSEKTMKVLKLLLNTRPPALLKLQQWVTLPTFKNITQLFPQWEPSTSVTLILRDHGEGNSREHAVTKSETRNSELRSCYFSQDRLKFHRGMLPANTARRQPSASPFVNLYLYLVGNWVPPKAWHMVPPEAKIKILHPSVLLHGFASQFLHSRKQIILMLYLKKNT